MDAETWKVLAASYERSAVSMREQADKAERGAAILGFVSDKAASFRSAAYTADVLRSAALDVIDYLEKKNAS